VKDVDTQAKIRAPRTPECNAQLVPTFSTDRWKVRRLAKLRLFPSAAKSPWSWPIFALVALAAVGQWAGVIVAEALAAGFGAVGIGVAIGLVVAGKREDREEPSGASQAGARATSGLPQTRQDPKDASRPSRRTVDLRGARLVNAVLVSADLRQADLRGATLTGADLSGADLTGAQLGPLDEG
jgi:hypothetical protein